MPTYSVTFQTYANTSITVEADSEGEAVEVASEELPQLCHHCDGPMYLDDWNVETVEVVQE